MCLVVVAVDVHPRYRVVIAANRDEFHARPTQPAHWWDEGWLAGRDLAGGGTWLGVTRSGRWALLTNIRDPARFDPKAPSRGLLVTGVLADRAAPAVALQTIANSSRRHNGFNLLAGDVADVHWASNRNAGAHALAAGVHGLSNHLLDTPWPKVVRTKAAVAAWCAAAPHGAPEFEPLFEILRDRTEAADADLPATGIPLDRERLLSAPFIVSDTYGTRSSTVLAFGVDGGIRFIERSFDPAGGATGEVDAAFVREPAGSGERPPSSLRSPPPEGDAGLP
jgi:uncharacterized protein with NRDE domain